MSTEVGGWSKKGEIMSTWLLNDPLGILQVMWPFNGYLGYIMQSSSALLEPYPFACTPYP